jgi:hypothetical protein
MQNLTISKDTIKAIYAFPDGKSQFDLEVCQGVKQRDS